MTTTPHEITLKGQPIADQWMAECVCGWRQPISIYEAEDRHFAGQLAIARHCEGLPTGSVVMGEPRP